MKVSYVEGLASYGGPETCVRIREGGIEALTGVRAGRVLSRVIHAPGRKVRTLFGNREIPRPSAARRETLAAERIEKPKGVQR